MATEKHSSDPSSKKLLPAADGDHPRNPQQVNMRRTDKGLGIPLPCVYHTALPLRLREHHSRCVCVGEI